MNQNARILIVDDEPHLRHLSSRLLRKAGYEVAEASTGRDCLRMAQQDRPDLILLDVILPDMGGLEVCRQIKSDARLADVYVLLLSAFKTASEDQAEGLEAGAEGYIVRPVSNRELVARVESLLHLKWAKEALREQTRKLNERVKELNCLYRISHLVEKPDISLEEILQGTAELIPPAWQDPETTSARIILEGQEFRTDNFREAATWRQTAEIVVHGRPRGTIEVQRTTESPEGRGESGSVGAWECGGEGMLLKAIAERLGRIVERKWAEEQLRRYQVIVSTISDPISYVDKDYTYRQVNETYAKYAKKPREEIVGLKIGNLLGTEAFERHVKPHLDQCLAGQEVHYQAWFDVPGEDPKFMDVGYYPVYGEDRSVLGAVVNSRDTTGRKRAEEALHRYADRLRVLHEIDQAVLAARSAEEIAEAALRHMRKLVPCMRASVALFDADQGVLLAADCVGEARAEKGTHFSSGAFDTQALAQGEVLSFTDIQDLPHPSPLLRALQADGVRSCINVPLIAGAELIGSLNLGADSPGPFAPEHIEIACEVADSLAIGIQQTRLYEQVRQHTVELERHVAERTAELRASEMRFRTLFEQAAIGIALVDGEGRLAGSNPALQEMLGYSGEELLGKALTDLIHPLASEGVWGRGDRPVARTSAGEGTAALDQHRELMDGQQDTYGTERRYVRKDGRLVWVNLTASVVRAEDGKPQFAIYMMEDITEKKRTQAALLQAEKLAIAGKLAASLTHEISNPLQSVIGCLGLAEEALAEGENVDPYLQIALQELRRVARIVARLRNLHRPSQPEERVLTDVNALLERSLSLSRKKCQDHGVEVDWRAAADLPPLLLAVDQMQQVFLNLLLNAVEAMPQGGRLRMSTNRTHQPAGVCISFEDNGAGIAHDVLPHIFDPFYSTKPEGLGLGLFISLDIVKQHGGHIDVESELGRGTRFKVWLPA